MESSQLLLIIAITITTILIVVVGLQLIFFLKELRKAISKNGDIMTQLEKKHVVAEKHKGSVHHKGSPTLHAILDRIRILSPHDNSKNKRFFIKEK